MAVSLDMYVNAGVGVLALLLGFFFTGKIPFLKRFCIPVPVSGGLLISLVALLLYCLFGIECRFDGTLRDLFMMVFFTSVGFQSDLKVFRKGGRPLIVMIVLVAVLIAVQNLISVGIACGLDRGALLGMAAGSIPMCGGHGTSGGFSPLLESMGLTGAEAITMAAATFGLVAGSLLGGPLGEALIRRHGLGGDEISPRASLGRNDKINGTGDYLKAVCLVIVAMALGRGVNWLLMLTGITFPTYFGALVAAFAMRNLLGLSPKLSRGFCEKEIVSVGNIGLMLFLGMAMAGLRLWELASLALPLTLILLAQVVFMALYGAFVAFPLLGKNYDSAVMVSGLCGFGLGATPNAMANMSAVCYKYHYAAAPFIIVPIIGAMFVDIINTGVVTLFLNLL